MKPYSIVYYPPFDPLTSQYPPVLTKLALSIKQCPDTCTLHSNLTQRQPDRSTDMLLCILVAPETLLHSAKFQPCNPWQSKVILIHVNSTDYPLTCLICTLKISCIGYHKYTPFHIFCKTLPKNIEY